jgi:hypothetical protein
MHANDLLLAYQSEFHSWALFQNKISFHRGQVIFFNAQVALFCFYFNFDKGEVVCVLN